MGVGAMNRWYDEEWEFTTTVQRVGPDDRPTACRLGLEVGDAFTSTYECPAGFCPKAMMKAYAIMEAVRAGGDLRLLGGDGPAGMTFCCPDGVVTFQLIARRLGAPEE